MDGPSSPLVQVPTQKNGAGVPVLFPGVPSQACPMLAVVVTALRQSPAFVDQREISTLRLVATKTVAIRGTV
ncbi:hypothetical protein KIN20_028368 [Parelaphostrongylus tenuis]|uniref:Uncharacterized protein n=1 Tax=Parelaphostrongylus tenuis TaxID=148309 RepID=A0AAD5R0Q7_PARTN|nr:hypothetical protein KIN20_028368 [Parelaphostrongylus tenuis]